ncbi:hypothetical protein FRC08_004713 [Ceratobasidium sp. 394]|nr:hypothetical protein FRC08_004713 [Ceratobasidium sp. 394]
MGNSAKKQSSELDKLPLSATAPLRAHDRETSVHKTERGFLRLFGKMRVSGTGENRSQGDDSTTRASEPARGTVELTPPKAKGVADGPEFGYAEFQFFVVDSDVYGYDYTLIVCNIDQQNGAIFAAELSCPNPPTPNSIFVIGRASFKFDFSGILLRNITGDKWDPERTYVIFADACQAATQGSYSRLPDSTTEPINSLSNYAYSPNSFETPAASTSSQGAQSYSPGSAANEGNGHKHPLRRQRAAPLESTMFGLNRVQPPTSPPALHFPQDQQETHPGSSNNTFPSSTTSNTLQPEWLLLGRVPSKEQVDDLVEAVKFERKNHETGGGPQLKCPLSACGYNKELRRPQALRDHLYFHFGIKPYPCGRNGCDKTFQTKANRGRHFETCRR